MKRIRAIASPCVNPLGADRFFDCMVSSSRRRRSVWGGAQWLLAIIAIELVPLAWVLLNVAHAEETHPTDIRTLKGQTIDIYAMVCFSRRDATALLSHLRRGGATEALTYVRGGDNTCILDNFKVIVGPIVATATAPDGGAWNVVVAASIDGRAHAYMVTSKMLSTLPQNTTLRT